MSISVARLATQTQIQRWEAELRDIEARLEQVRNMKKPYRIELHVLGKRREELMRKLGLLP